MRRHLLLLALAGASLGRGAASQTITARVGGNLTGFVGTPLTVPILVDLSNAGGAALGSYTARLSWNPAVLSCYYYPCLMGGDFPTPQANTDSLAQGVLRVTAVSPGGATGLVTLAQVQLQITDTTTSAVSLGFSEMSAAGTFANLLPSLTVSGGTFCAAKGRWADLDNDGSANSRDALVILSNLVGLPVDTTLFKLPLGDADGDALVNSRDALIILSYAVGLDIPGQRVLLPAPRCGATSPRQLAVLPAAASLGPAQTVQLFLRAVDSLGQGSAVPGATWRSSDYTVATVDGSGLVTARAAGNATISAEVAPGLRAVASITVLARRSSWYVDIRATGAPVQLGTSTEPFESPTQAMAFAGEGDTIRVAPGTYAFTGAGTLNAGVVLIGGTPGDTTTRPIFSDPTNSYTALYLSAGVRTAVYNVAFDNFYTAVGLNGVRSFALEDGKIRLRSGAYGYGLQSCSSEVDSIRIDRTTMLGDSSTRSGYGINLDGCARVGRTTIRDSKIRFWNYGVYLYEADSTAVLGSEISDNAGYGVYIDQEDVVRPAVYLAHSRVERNASQGVYVDYARRLVVDTSVVRATMSDGVYVYGDSYGGLTQVYLHGDSIYQESAGEADAWLRTFSVDSLVVDGTVVRFPADTSLSTSASIYAARAFVSNSKFLNIGASSSPFYFHGREARFDNVDFTGCNVAGCDGGRGPELYPDAGTLQARIQNSRFTRVGYPAYLYDGGIGGSALTLTGNTVDSATTGFYAYGDSVAVSDNVLTRIVGSGILIQDWSPGRASSAVGNQLSCTPSPSTQRGIELYGGTFLVQADTVTDCRQGVYVSGVRSGTVLRDLVLRNPVHGVWVQQGDSATVQLLANAISGADTAAVLVYSGRISMRGNNIGNNERDGLAVPFFTGYVSQADSNAFAGNARYAVYAGSDSVNAPSNWWGNAAGPGGGVADSVFGRVGAATPLPGPPSGLPGFAPPVGAGSHMETPVAATAAAPPVAPRTARAVPRPVQSALGLAASRMTVDQRVRLQRHEARRAEREGRP